MRKRLLLPAVLLGLGSSGIACNVPDPFQFQPHINDQIQPGERGTLLELPDDRHWIREIALSDNYLFVAVSWAGIFRMPKYGGEVVALDEDPKAEFYHLAVDGGRVYWIHVTFDDRDYPFTQVKSQPVEGGPTRTITAGEFGIVSSNTIDHFQATGGDVYWAYDTGGDTPGRIDRVPTGGGARQVMATYVDASSIAPWIADDSGLYVTTDSAIEHIATPGQEPEVIANSPAAKARPVGQDANAVYFESSTGLWSMSKADRSLSKIAVTAADGYGGSAAGFDDANIYGVDGWQNPRTLVRFPKAGGTPTAIADVTGCLVYGGGPQLMAIDPQYVFLVCGDSNRIILVPNPPAP